MFLTIIVFLLILSVLVLVHEAGHFIVAKLLKIKVEEFGFGLPPKVFGIKFGETLYSLNLLPIGGFVKLYGEDDAGSGRVSLSQKAPSDMVESRAFAMREEEIEIASSDAIIKEERIEISEKTIINEKNKGKNAKLDRAFYARPVWQRALVVVAGVFMNFILAVVILSFLFSIVGVPVPTEKVLVSTVIKGAPAEKVGLKVGDIIESVSGKKITSTLDVMSIARKNAGKEITLNIKTSKGKQEILKITPRINYPKDQGPMGVVISQEVVIKKYPWYQAPFVGTKEALKETWMIGSGLVMLVGQLVTKGVVPQDVAGPVGIAQLTGRVVDIGPFAVLSFISLLSLNLALINILPIPALDGGRLLFIAIEALTRKKVNPNVEGYAHTIGMVILLALIALITLHDLFRLFTGQPILPK